MQRKFKECQGVWTQAYQHQGGFAEGDKVWFQPLNGNSWLGPAMILCQRGQSVWLQTHGYIKKIAACWVKLFEFVDIDSFTKESAKKVMLEDRHEVVENLFSYLKDDTI